ncbi:putative expansin-B2 [Sesamum alatum]|uniref:Expansin-B2 n=1 Tax=Sesamum alatum TaxID=300844 RepID=A0AAE2CA48_9LAMI|nr:putative expansin-B2 [Sesamum alatum]
MSKLESGSDWSPARASWYGNPSGAGSDGGACGYGNAVEAPPFSSLITAAASSLYNSGKACGTCFQVKCTSSKVCSGNPVTVVITDECPGCDSQSLLFDLSGTSFGTMAHSGEADQLRNVGIEQIQYRRVPCDYPNTALAFEVDSGSNPYYFACVVKYVKGDGDLSSVELQTVNSNQDEWRPMQHSWGATWKIDLDSGAKPPFSIRLITRQSKKVIVAKHVIPANWQPGKSYNSLV